MAQDVVGFVMARLVIPAAMLGVLGGIVYAVERCSSGASDEQPTPAQSAAKHRDSSDAGTKRGDGGLTAAQREKIRQALARLDGGFRYRPPTERR
jgi:hypothetical protein